MSNLIITKELIIPELSPGERDLLILIYTQNKLLYTHYFKVYNTSIPIALKSLENKLYIKIVDDNFDSLDSFSLRDKALKLFKKNPLEVSIDNILNYLNEKSKKPRGFRLTSNANRKFISARLKEGYTEQELKDVIDVKVENWLGTEQELYLRPATLFNDEKFQSYINQVDLCKKREKTINRM